VALLRIQQCGALAPCRGREWLYFSPSSIRSLFVHECKIFRRISRRVQPVIPASSCLSFALSHVAAIEVKKLSSHKLLLPETIELLELHVIPDA
jgi:hypothetical protein